MKKILLAGGAGYIGTLLTRDLVKRGYNVTVVDSFWFGNHLPKGINTIHKDIIDLDEADLEGHDVVVFLAGVSNDPMAEYNPPINFIENTAAPSCLAYMSKKAGIKRFIYASSCSVYGYTSNKLTSETSTVSPQFPYGISKLSTENSIINMEDDNFKPIALRKGTVGGYSPRMRFDLVVNTMVRSALLNNKIVVNNPSIWRPLLDVRDAVAAYIRAIEANLKISGVYNILYDNYTIGRLADEIRDELSVHGYDVDIEVKDIFDIRNYKVSSEKAKVELDFSAKYSPRDSVRSILENMDVNSIDFSNKNYYNIKVFKTLF